MVEASRRARNEVNVEMKGIATDARKSLATIGGGSGGLGKNPIVKMADEGEVAYKRIRAGARAAATGMAQEFDTGLSRAESHIRRFGYQSLQTFGRLTRSFGRLGLDIAKGIGVDLSIGGIINKNIGLQQRAVDVSNSGFNVPGIASSKARVSSADIVRGAREAANAAALDPEQALEGLQAFVSKTGDLKTGRDLLADMAKLAKATGGNMRDYVDAAGDVANGLGDVEDKGSKVMMIMRGFAAQGKMGAVEIKDLATQMAKISAAAGAFGGDANDNFATMGAALQEARARGGAASPTIAATAILSAVSDLKTEKKANAFKAAGVELRGKGGKFRNLEDIIVDSLVATNGDFGKFNKLFSSQRGGKAAEGFATVFRDAGGGAKGAQAVHDEFQRLKNAQVGKGELNDSLKAAMATDVSKIQLFNNKLGEMGESIAGRILPQMERLAPVITSAVESLGSIVAWAAENPMEAVVTALVASVVKAGAETALRGALESAVRAMLGGGASPLGGAAGGLLGAGEAGAAGLFGGGAAAAVGAGLGVAALGGGVMLGAAYLEGPAKEREQRAKTQDALRGVDAPRSAIVAALRANGVDVGAGAGLGVGSARQLGFDVDTADALEKAAREAGAGKSFGSMVSMDAKNSLLANTPFGPPTLEGSKPDPETKGPGLADVLTQQRAGSDALAAKVDQSNALLAQIAQQGLLGPSVEGGGRTGPPANRGGS